METRFRLEVATPEKLLVACDAISAQIPTLDGFIGVLPDHAPLLSGLGSGNLSYVTPDERRLSLTIEGGFVEILSNQVSILTGASATLAP